MSQLHKIDRPEESKKYTKLELDEFMVFCILDTAVPYEMVCKVFDALKKKNLTTRKGLDKAMTYTIRNTLKGAGYRFPMQHATRLKAFGKNDINLRKATRNELVKNIKGIGMKLASMFLRNTRGEDYAVLDVHTLRWLQTNHKFPDDIWKRMTYQEKETFFRLDAKFLGKTTKELDLEIWQKMRVGNR